jgi:hypothetical protein
MARNGRDGYRCLAHRVAAKNTSHDRFLVFFIEQCALDHLGLACSRMGNGGLAGDPGRHEHQGRKQKRDGQSDGEVIAGLSVAQFASESPVVES